MATSDRRQRPSNGPQKLTFGCVCLVAILVAVGCDQAGNAPLKPAVAAKTAADIDIEAGLKLFQERKHSEAVHRLEQALDKPYSVVSQSMLLTIIGNGYNELGQFDKSLDFHERAIAADPQNHRAYVNRGVTYRLQNKFDKAAESYAKALEIKPDYAELHASLGALAVHQEKYEEAIKHLEHANQLQDSLPVAHSNLAIAYACVGRFDDADRQLKKAIVLGYRQPELIQERIDRLRQVADKM